MLRFFVQSNASWAHRVHCMCHKTGSFKSEILETALEGNGNHKILSFVTRGECIVKQSYAGGFPTFENCRTS